MPNSYSISSFPSGPNLSVPVFEPSNTSPPALSAVEWKILDKAGAYPKGMPFTELHRQLMPDIGQDALRDAVSACLKRNLLSGDFMHLCCTDHGLTMLVDNAYAQLMPPEPDTWQPSESAKQAPGRNTEASSGTAAEGMDMKAPVTGAPGNGGPPYPTQKRMTAAESLAWKKIHSLARSLACDTPAIGACAQGMHELRLKLHAFVDALAAASNAGRARQKHRAQRGHDNHLHKLFQEAEDCAWKIWDRVMEAYCVSHGGQLAKTPRLFAMYEPTLIARLTHMGNGERQAVIATVTRELERLDDESEAAKQGSRQLQHYSRALQVVRWLADDVQAQASRRS